MVAYARRRAGADAVGWILGDSRSIPPGVFDYAVMSRAITSSPATSMSRDLSARIRTLVSTLDESRRTIDNVPYVSLQ